MDSDLHCLSIGLLARNPLDKDSKFLPVATHNFALAVMVSAAKDHHFVVLADRDGPDVVLCFQLLAERAAHDLTADVRGRGEVHLPGLAPGGADARLLLHRA